MSRQSRQEGGAPDEQLQLMKRIERMERAISELVVVVNALKGSVDTVLNVREQEPRIARSNVIEEVLGTRRPAHLPAGNVLGVVDERRANPWALEAALKLLDDRIEKQAIKASFDIYKPTLDVLRSKPEGASADEVSRITGRKRNTESTYLNRLCRAGLLQRKKRGNKVVFMIESEGDIYQVFGETG